MNQKSSLIQILKSVQRVLTSDNVRRHIKLDIKVAFQELSKRITSIKADGPHQFLRSNFISGIKSLPVRIKRT